MTPQLTRPPAATPECSRVRPIGVIGPPGWPNPNRACAATLSVPAAGFQCTGYAVQSDAGMPPSALRVTPPIPAPAGKSIVEAYVVLSRTNCDGVPPWTCAGIGEGQIW